MLENCYKLMVQSCYLNEEIMSWHLPKIIDIPKTEQVQSVLEHMYSPCLAKCFVLTLLKHMSSGVSYTWLSYIIFLVSL